MHTTTVRFPRDTWEQLRVGADRDGVAVAQYIREAAIARLATGGQLHLVAGLGEEVQLLDLRVRRIEAVLMQAASRAVAK